MRVGGGAQRAAGLNAGVADRGDELVAGDGGQILGFLRGGEGGGNASTGGVALAQQVLEGVELVDQLGDGGTARCLNLRRDQRQGR